MFLGIDIGGTKIAAALVDGKGRILKEKRVLTASTREAILQQLKDLIKELSGKSKRIGIGVPGLYTGTKLITLPNLRALEGVDLKTLGKIVVENDASCMALAEQAYGAAKGKKFAVVVGIGTGLGSGIIIDGKLYRGANNAAGEVGHAMNPEGVEWESLLSGPAIEKRLRSYNGIEKPEELWTSQSEAARKTRAETAKLLATFATMLIVSFDPEIIIIGGGVANKILVDDANALLPKYGKKPILRLSKLGVKAGVLGAASLASSASAHRRNRGSS